MTDTQLIKIAASALETKKCENIRCLKISEISSVANYFLIASGNNPLQVKAAADETELALSKNELLPQRTEGYKGANWIVLDYIDVIIHIFHKDTRDFYGLEKLWREAEEIEISSL